MSTGFAPTEELTKQDVLTPYDDGDHDLFAHVVPKLALERAIFEGIPAIALCGKRWLPTKDAKRYPVCPTCKEILDTYWPGPEEVK